MPNKFQRSSGPGGQTLVADGLTCLEPISRRQRRISSSVLVSPVSIVPCGGDVTPRTQLVPYWRCFWGLVSRQDHAKLVQTGWPLPTAGVKVQLARLGRVSPKEDKGRLVKQSLY